MRLFISICVFVLCVSTYANACMFSTTISGEKVTSDVVFLGELKQCEEGIFIFEALKIWKGSSEEEIRVEGDCDYKYSKEASENFFSKEKEYLVFAKKWKDDQTYPSIKIGDPFCGYISQQVIRPIWRRNLIYSKKLIELGYYFDAVEQLFVSNDSLKQLGKPIHDFEKTKNLNNKSFVDNQLP